MTAAATTAVTATARASVPAGRTRIVKVKLSKAVFRRLQRMRSVTLSATLTPPGVTNRLIVPPYVKPTPRFDGTYRGKDGLTIVVKRGKVVNFQGNLSLWCTKSKRRKSTFFTMSADDPDPAVG